ncbi:MAG: hypothetical protein HKN12_08440 [Gemmatimonadetes bacterium]|nr:hypothetical protein [Gemmatimonadota bacterium]
MPATAPNRSAATPRGARSAIRRRIQRRRLATAWTEEILGWCDGRWWALRVPVLVYLAYAWIRHTQLPTYQSLFKGLNLGIHELGHFVFAGLGEMPAVLGGSFLQCFVPILAIFMFLYQRDYFGIAFSFGWLGTNYFEVAVYAGDAVLKRLPLVTPGGGEPIHDWNYLLGNYGWLRHTETIAGAHAAMGHLCMALSLAAGGWLTWLMFRSALRRRLETGL